MKTIIIFMFLIIILCSFTFALDVDYVFNVVGSKVVVENSLEFDKVVSGNYSFRLPNDANAVSVYVDGELVESNRLIRLKNNKFIKIRYVTKEVLDENNFVFDFNANYDIDNLKVRLVLSEGSTLRTVVKDGESSSIFPDANLITTDGRSIVLEWNREDLAIEDNLSFFVRFHNSSNYMFYIILILIALVIFFVIRYVVFARVKAVENELIESIDTKSANYGFEAHLKSAEEQVVNVLKMKEGACEQGTLRIATGFSKAALSRLLAELESRNVIHKEKRGKKNLVFLKKR